MLTSKRFLRILLPLTLVFCGLILFKNPGRVAAFFVTPEARDNHDLAGPWWIGEYWRQSRIRLFYGLKEWYFYPSEIEKWVVIAEVNGNSVAQLDDEKINQSLDPIAMALSQPGWMLDRTQAINGIKTTLSQSSNREVGLRLTPGAWNSYGVQTGRFAGKYIEIDLSKQMLYAIEGDWLRSAYRVSTGREGMNTPTGVFSILDKAGTVRCRPSPDYRTCTMPLSQHFTRQGHAIHELPFVNGRREGASHLGRRVSHGCVRLGIGPAGDIYQWAPIGAPVWIHK